MKKGWMLVLLISLGLNLGLGLRLLGVGAGPEDAGSRAVRPMGGPWAARDTAARRAMFDRRLRHIAGRLDLRPEQREVFRQVQGRTGRMLMQERIRIAEKRDLLHSLMTSDKIDQDRIRRAIGELGQEQAVLDSLVAETVLQEMAVLDSRQRERYLEMLAFEKGGPRGRWGRGRRGPHRQ